MRICYHGRQQPVFGLSESGQHFKMEAFDSAFHVRLSHRVVLYTG
nr:MAG TPA: hypothetical protein [Caudoviricetes sp.]